MYYRLRFVKNVPWAKLVEFYVHPMKGPFCYDWSIYVNNPIQIQGGMDYGGWGTSAFAVHVEMYSSVCIFQHSSFRFRVRSCPHVTGFKFFFVVVGEGFLHFEQVLPIKRARNEHVST